MNTTEAAEILRIHPDTVGRWCQRGRLTSRKHGDRWHISPEVVEAMRLQLSAPLVCVDCGNECSPGQRIALCDGCQLRRNNKRPFRKERRRIRQNEQSATG